MKPLDPRSVHLTKILQIIWFVGEKRACTSRHAPFFAEITNRKNGPPAFSSKGPSEYNKLFHIEAISKKSFRSFDRPFDRLTVLSKVEGLMTLSNIEGPISVLNLHLKTSTYYSMPAG
jgi:hypothetical protein